ncbi:MAG TPA: ATP-binding protein, partial [Paraburkholderia sp.]|uniref:sensor histidine kinase n=1 Tax=Paraburkholderia sp. TaxID=1926495 RepID=UPI002B49B883
LAHGKQTLGECVGAAHDLLGARGGPSINASRTLRDDVFQRYFSGLLDTGIAAALEWLTAEFNRNGRTVCHFHLQDENIVVSEGIAIVLFRIAQEALTNVARHAEADNVILRLERMPDAYQLGICDDGIGFDRLQIGNRSFGLAGMEERVQMLGGQIEIASSPGIGTAIKVKFPVD